MITTLLYLAIEFMKTGLFAVGGGLATIPFLKEIATNYDWFKLEELTDMIAISESTPGPIGINMSTYSGFKAEGLIGAAVATISIVVPPIIIILIISKVFEKFKTNKYVEKMFSILRPASTGLILGAMMDIFIMSLFYQDNFNQVIELIKNNNIDVAYILDLVVNWKSVLFFVLAFFGVRKFKKFHPIVFIASGAIFGIFLGL